MKKRKKTEEININDYDRGLLSLTFPTYTTKNEEQEFISELLQNVRIDHFKLELPNARFITRNCDRELNAYIASILRDNNGGLFSGQPFRDYSSWKFNNVDWHFTSPALKLRSRYVGDNMRVVHCPLKLDLNFTRFCAHHAGAAGFRSNVRTGLAQILMRRNTSVAAALSALTLNDSDNIIPGSYYPKTRAPVQLMQSYLRCVFEFFEQAFGQRQGEEELREAAIRPSEAFFAYTDILPYVDRQGNLIRDAEFYVDFKHPNAIDAVKRVGRMLIKIARNVQARAYASHIASYLGQDDEVHCHSYRMALNSGRELKIYAKTTTRVRMEVCFPRSIRYHIRQIYHDDPMEEIKLLFQRGLEIAAADIAAVLRELTRHQPERKKERRVTPLVFSQFLHAVAEATEGDARLTQKIIGELLERQSVRAGNDPILKMALRHLEQKGVLQKTGIEKRVTKPVYVLSETYDQIILHLVERGKKLKLVKK